jgi:hypothetical protein
MYQHVQKKENLFWQTNLEQTKISEDEEIIELYEDELIEE